MGRTGYIIYEGRLIMDLITKSIKGALLIVSFCAILVFRKPNRNAAMWAMVTFLVTLETII